MDGEENMYSMILTDYRSISKTIDLIETFSQRVKGVVHYIIVDNSDLHEGKKFLDRKKILYEKNFFLSKETYTFVWKDNEIVLIDANENGGYAKGNNIGAAYSASTYGDSFYIFSNNDLEFPGKFDLEVLSQLVKSNPKIGIIGINIITKDGDRQNPRLDKGFCSQMLLWDFNVLWFHCKLNKILWNLDLNNVEGETGWVSGSFLFVNKEAFDIVDGFDEKTFLYCEEMIISEKMRKKGYVTYYYPNISIVHIHQGSQTRKSRYIQHNSKKYFYHRYKNVPYFLCVLSDVTYFISEIGYYLWHDCLKKMFCRKKR